MNNSGIYVMSKDEIEGLRAASKIASATLKHALDNTKVTINFTNINEE